MRSLLSILGVASWRELDPLPLVAVLICAVLMSVFSWWLAS